MSRLFTLFLPRPVREPHARGGARHTVTLRADEPADALRFYFQQYPNGPEPTEVVEVPDVQDHLT